MSENKKQKEIRAKVAKVVTLRNRFFFMMYRYSILVFIFSLLACISSIFFLFSFANRPVPPQFIPVNEDGTYIKMKPLNECIEDKDVQKFVAQAANKLYKYDYINYADQLQSAASYFTTQGWNDYLDQYSNSKTLNAVKENKWVVTVEPVNVPIIQKRWIEDGVCTWDLHMPITLRFIGNNSQAPRGDLHVRVTRNSVINNPEGLGIKALVLIENGK